MAKRILVTGATGLIGSRFLELYGGSFNTAIFLQPREEKSKKFEVFSADLLEYRRILEIVAKAKPELVLHFAAFTDVDGAESQKGNENGLVWNLNVVATEKLTRAAQENKATFVYVSTDFVFDGKIGPYSEENQVAKSQDEISWYGWTKLQGERRVQSFASDFLICRTSYPYRAKHPQKLDFARNILQRLKEGNLYPMFDDQFFTPTFVDDFCLGLKCLIENNQIGIWHVTDSTTLSAHEASLSIAQVFGYDKNLIKKTSTDEFLSKNPKAAPRPQKGGLENSKIQNFLSKLGLGMLTFEEALRRMKSQMEKEK